VRPESITRQVSICNQRLRVEIRPGNGSGIPLVMCSGLGASYEVLQPLVDAIDPGVEIIRFDAPGVGESPAALWPIGFPQLAYLLKLLLDELGYGRVDVLGFSWGGALAQQFAVQHHARCRRLVLISTSTGVLSVPAAPRVFLQLATARRFRDYAAAMAGPLHDGDPGGRTDDAKRLFRQAKVAFSGRGFVYQLAAVSVWSSLPFLRLIRQPVLVMGGDHDQIVPALNARILAMGIPHATLSVFPGGHLAPLFAAAEAGPQISEFLAVP
jgi:poly(3-hydroxyalkanoate) depolymerase